jgi:hypothetical protein
MAHLSLAVFILASILTRGRRFFMIAGPLCWYADPTTVRQSSRCRPWGDRNRGSPASLGT